VYQDPDTGEEYFLNDVTGESKWVESECGLDQGAPVAHTAPEAPVASVRPVPRLQTAEHFSKLPSSTSRFPQDWSSRTAPNSQIK